MPTAIEFNHISKQYRLGLVSTRTLSHDLNRWWTINVLRKEDPYLKIGETNDRSTKGSSEYVWALRDIDFKIEQGDVVGIIGKNGAGKSTLLKLLSRVTAPTTGTIRAKGRIASLLEVGTGFHPEMTGRENIFMNGAIMGMTKQEIRSKLDEIVDFSGCERYLDTPVKRYSSGMMVRLGFAVAAHLDPEILVVDEVLAVGDAEFQKKAIGKMQDVSKGEGRTVLFVSHNMMAVRNLCKSAVLLENGQMALVGNVDEVLDYYVSNNTYITGRIIDSINILSEDVKIEEVLVNNQVGNILFLEENANSLEVKVCGELNRELCIDLEMSLQDSNGQKMGFYSSGHLSGSIHRYPKGKFILDKRIKLPNNINKGSLFVNLYLTHPNVAYWMKAEKCLRLDFQGISNSMGAEISIRDSGFILLRDE